MTRVAFFGAAEFAVPSLEMLLQEGYEVVAVYTQPDRRAGRGRRESASPVKGVAQAHGLRLLQPETLRTSPAVTELAALLPDVVVLAAYGLLLPEALLAVPSRGCLNIHPSLLPRHRGPAPVVATLLAGDTETGSTVFLMDKGMDTGPILAQRALSILPGETAGSLTGRMARQGADLLRQTLPSWLRGEIVPVPQDGARATYSRLVRKEDGLLDWSRTAEELARRVQAFSPWPSAYTRWEGRRVKVLEAQARGGEGEGPVGTVVETGRPGEAGVVTGRGVLALRRVQLEGRRALPIEAFLQGQSRFLGTVLRGRPGEL